MKTRQPERWQLYMLAVDFSLPSMCSPGLQNVAGIFRIRGGYPCANPASHLRKHCHRQTQSVLHCLPDTEIQSSCQSQPSQPPKKHGSTAASSPLPTVLVTFVPCSSLHPFLLPSSIALVTFIHEGTFLILSCHAYSYDFMHRSKI